MVSDLHSSAWHFSIVRYLRRRGLTMREDARASWILFYMDLEVVRSRPEGVKLALPPSRTFLSFLAHKL